MPGDLGVTLQDGLPDNHGSVGLSLPLKFVLSLGLGNAHAEIPGQQRVRLLVGIHF